MGINFGRRAPYLCITGIGWTLLPAAVPVRTLPTASPKYRGAGWRATTFERPRSTVVIVVGAAGGGAAEFMYFLDNNFVGDASLLHYRPQITAGTRPAVVLIYDPYSYAIKRDLYGATITFTPPCWSPSCISPTTVLLWHYCGNESEKAAPYACA